VEWRSTADLRRTLVLAFPGYAGCVAFLFCSRFEKPDDLCVTGSACRVDRRFDRYLCLNSGVIRRFEDDWLGNQSDESARRAVAGRERRHDLRLVRCAKLGPSLLARGLVDTRRELPLNLAGEYLGRALRADAFALLIRVIIPHGSWALVVELLLLSMILE
jgi:hypothetical protein